jgi:hypothetical protein
MNIRKIIREELESDWDWANEASEYQDVEGVKKLLKNKKLESDLYKFLIKNYTDKFFVLELEDGKGVLDLTISGYDGIEVMYFPDVDSWNKHFMYEYPVFEDLSDLDDYSLVNNLREIFPIKNVKISEI